mmetsp:Transcript_15634/g.20375  ORF Transcript_15634/g.20375 Transcript_15634/m.20375 type:complete len:85 (-) Transcript_15634:36-290(-)
MFSPNVQFVLFVESAAMICRLLVSLGRCCWRATGAGIFFNYLILNVKKSSSVDQTMRISSRFRFKLSIWLTYTLLIDFDVITHL